MGAQGGWADTLRGPGTDTRLWQSLAYVNSGSGPNGADVVIDPAEGVFVGVTLMPSGQQETARLGSAYAANGASDYVPLIAGEEVLVSVPSGMQDMGLVIQTRLWSPSDPPAAAMVTHPTDPSTTLPADVSYRRIASGLGSLIYQVGAGFVVLGDETATDFDMRGTSFVAGLHTFLTALNTYVAAVAVAAPATAAAATTFEAAITAFQTPLVATPSPYLAQKVKVF